MPKLIKYIFNVIYVIISTLFGSLIVVILFPLYFVVLFFTVSICMMRDYIQEQRDKKEMEKEIERIGQKRYWAKRFKALNKELAIKKKASISAATSRDVINQRSLNQ